jgi:hypothetical protein
MRNRQFLRIVILAMVLLIVLALVGAAFGSK